MAILKPVSYSIQCCRASANHAGTRHHLAKLYKLQIIGASVGCTHACLAAPVECSSVKPSQNQFQTSELLKPLSLQDMARSGNTIYARVVAPPRYAGEPPLLNLQVYMTPANLTTSSLEGTLPPTRHLLQEVQDKAAFRGSLYGGIYVPAADELYEVSGHITAYLVFDPALREEASLVGIVTMTSFYKKSADQYMQPQNPDSTFASALSIGTGSFISAGALQSPQVNPGGYVALNWNHALLHAADNTSKAVLYEASIQLDAGAGLQAQGWYVANLWNGTGTFLGLCKASVNNYYSSYLSWSGPCSGWLLISNSNGTMQASVTGYTYSYALETSLVNGSLAHSGGLSGQMLGDVSLPVTNGTKCSACSQCIGTMAASMQHMLGERNATAVAGVFAAICRAQRKSTLCSEVQALVVASREGNLGECPLI